MKNIGAFFDIDGTLARKSLMENHFRRLVQNEIIAKEKWEDIRPIYDDYKRRYTEYDQYLEAVAGVYNESITGLSYDIIDFFAEMVIEDRSELVYSYTRSRLSYHQKMGHKVFFISGSPEFLVRKMADYYKVDGYRATVFEVKDNHFTSGIVPMWKSASKKAEMEKIRDNYGLDMDYSYAYGDTTGDIAMLESVGNPIAINPARNLLDYIQDNEDLSKKVKIVVERKDVIYSIPADIEILNK